MEPGFSGWPTAALALACALVIGGVGGLIGLGGGEFRLPILVGLLGFAARAAVPMNQILSLVTLTTAFAMRWHHGLLVGVGDFAPAVAALGVAGTDGRLCECAADLEGLRSSASNGRSPSC